MTLAQLICLFFLGLLACPSLEVPSADRRRLLGPCECPILFGDFCLVEALDMPGFCMFCGWPPEADHRQRSQQEPPRILAFFARFLAAPQQLFQADWRPRVPTSSVSPSRFSKVWLQEDRCSSPVRGVPLLICPVPPPGDSEQEPLS